MNNPLFVTAFVLTLINPLAHGIARATDAPPAGDVGPGWYPPPPGSGWYPAPRQPAPGWNGPPRGYYPMPPRYTPPVQPMQPRQAGQQTMTPAENPLSAELKRLQDQLTATRAKLETTQTAVLTSQAALEALRREQAQGLDQQRLLNEQLVTASAAQATLQARVLELGAALDKANADLQQHQQQLADAEAAQQTLAGTNEQLRGNLASRDQQLATLQQQLDSAANALQTAQAQATNSSEQLAGAQAQSGALQDELETLSKRLQEQQDARLTAEQNLAEMTARSENLQLKLSALSQQPAGTDATLAAAPAPEVALAALEAAPGDTDGDGVADNVDLCQDTQPGIAVESTGCAINAAIRLEGVNFAYDSHVLTSGAHAILDRVAAILSQHPELTLEVAGHTDAQGDAAYNQWLSLQRAEAVRDYLVAKGVDPKNIGAVGYGGQRPVADNSTKEGLKLNRRVELRSLRTL